MCRKTVGFAVAVCLVVGLFIIVTGVAYSGEVVQKETSQINPYTPQDQVTAKKMLERGVDVETVAAIEHLRKNAPECLDNPSEAERKAAEAFAALSFEEKVAKIKEEEQGYKLLAVGRYEIVAFFEAQNNPKSDEVLQTFLEYPDQRVLDEAILIQYNHDYPFESARDKYALLSLQITCADHPPCSSGNINCAHNLPGFRNCVSITIDMPWPIPDLRWCGCGWFDFYGPLIPGLPLLAEEPLP